MNDQAAVDGDTIDETNTPGDGSSNGLDLGGFIRDQRERSKLSLRKLADTAGISNPYLSQIERGLRKPSAEILKSIARGLSISAETLYSQAGWLEERDEPGSVVEAIHADPLLDTQQQKVLLDLYRTFVRDSDQPEE